MRPAPASARWLACLLVGAGGWTSAAAQAPRTPGPPLVEAAGVHPTPRRAVRGDSLRPPDVWIARDKAQHVGGSFLLTLSGQYVLTDKAGLSGRRALPLAVGTTLVLGLLKEVADGQRARGPHFSWRDLAANAIGVAAGALVVAW